MGTVPLAAFDYESEESVPAREHVPSLATCCIRIDTETNFAARLAYCKTVVSLGYAGQQCPHQPSSH